MPRAIVYSNRNPADEHYKALVADQANPPSTDQLRRLRTRAEELAQRVAPEAVRLHYLDRAAEEDHALDSIRQGGWWEQAAVAAESGAPPAPGAVKLADAAAQPEQTSTDGYLEKIAKYVPAELVTLTTLAFAALAPTGTWVWVLVAGGAVANVLYLWGTALQGREATPMPRWYFYPLSALALVLWSIAVIGAVGGEIGISGSNAETEKTFVLALAAFLVPLADVIATALTDIGQEKVLGTSATPDPPLVVAAPEGGER
jgi:hypothetical protein